MFYNNFRLNIVTAAMSIKFAMIKTLHILILLFFTSTIQIAAQGFVEKSKLAEGEIYKVSVEAEGVLQIDHDFLSNALGLDPDNINPAHITLLTNGDGTVPLNNDADRIDDLIQIPTISEGLADGQFNNDDRMIFYAGSPDNISINNDKVQVQKNPYDFHNHLFIHISPNNSRKEVEIMDFSGNEDIEISEYLQYKHHEQELINLQDHVLGNHGSGNTWYGESFSIERKKDFTSQLKPNTAISPSRDISISFSFAGRAGSGADIKLKVNEEDDLFSISETSLSGGETSVARSVTASRTYDIQNISEISLQYLNRSNTDEGWLDYLTLNYYTPSPQVNPFGIIQHPDSKGLSTKYRLNTEVSDKLVMNITESNNIYALNIENDGDEITFTDKAHEEVQRYAVINKQQSFSTPEFVEKVSNQNLHSMETPECLVVYHPDFEEAVNTWIQHRSTYSKIKIAKANIFEIYNEFSGGSQDPAAVRDYARMHHERSEEFNYLVLFGDGSFDYRYINKNNPFNNYIPVFESNNSLNPINSFPTDDFYALLSKSEGGSLKGALDISVGRLPASNPSQAQTLVKKIIHYDTNSGTLGDWRLRNVYLADDEDSNKHIRDINSIAEMVKSNPIFNNEKVYFDAYPQKSEAGGIRIPGASESLNDNIYKGALTVTYLGHGGPFGMAQERVLDINQIQSWTNSDRLPVFITATCTFAPYDDPTINSAGKVLITKEEGGAIALLTTVRPVYATSNKRLTQAVYQQILQRMENGNLSLGDILKEAKNSNSDDTLRTNARKFTLLGDPTLHLAIPEYKVITTSINGNNAQIETDTAGPLAITNVSGYIADEFGDVITSFNGELTPTVFDKEETRKTLGQGSSVFEFKTQNNVLWKGRVPVVNGEFNFSFVLPKSIDPSIGEGKISYYAKSENQNIDAAGAYTDLLIGGFPEDTISNDDPPVVDLYLENTLFENGDKVGPNPFLYAELSDDIGINLSTGNLGKEIKAFLDGNTSDPIILNNFFEPSLEDYRAGTIKYPLDDLEAGWHELRLRAWDVTDQYSEATIQFFVVNEEENEIIEFSSYPNPFTDYTCLRLKTSLSPGTYKGELQIINTTGQFVEELPVDLKVEGSEVQCLKWHPGVESKGLFSGVYFARLKIINPSDNTDIYTSVHKLVYIE